MAQYLTHLALVYDDGYEEIVSLVDDAPFFLQDAVRTDGVALKAVRLMHPDDPDAPEDCAPVSDVERRRAERQRRRSRNPLTGVETLQVTYDREEVQGYIDRATQELAERFARQQAETALEGRSVAQAWAGAAIENGVGMRPGRLLVRAQGDDTLQWTSITSDQTESDVDEDEDEGEADPAAPEWTFDLATFARDIRFSGPTTAQVTLRSRYNDPRDGETAELGYRVFVSPLINHHASGPRGERLTFMGLGSPGGQVFVYLDGSIYYRVRRDAYEEWERSQEDHPDDLETLRTAGGRLR